MKYDGLEKKIAELFPGFKLESFTRTNLISLDFDDEAYTEIIITGFVKEKVE